jgi:hypothetical protein
MFATFRVMLTTVLVWSANAQLLDNSLRLTRRRIVTVDGFHPHFPDRYGFRPPPRHP